jgi:hypothetical protein
MPAFFGGHWFIYTRFCRIAVPYRLELTRVGRLTIGQFDSGARHVRYYHRCSSAWPPKRMAWEDSFALGRQSAHEEARALYLMLGHDGNTVEAIRELISVPQKIEYALR